MPAARTRHHALRNPSGPALGIGRARRIDPSRPPAPRTLSRLLLSCALLSAPGAQAEELADLSLEQLMAVPVVGASKYEQTQDRVAAAVTVITRDEIRSSAGWRTLDEALATLPGVHTTYDRQYSYVGVRGFGLAGDYMTRVLVTIDGVLLVCFHVRRRPLRPHAAARHGSGRAHRIHPRPGRRGVWPERHVRRGQRDHAQGRGARRRVLGLRGSGRRPRARRA